MNADLGNLTVAGAFVREITITPELLAISILRGPMRKDQNSIVEEIRLEFRQVEALELGFHIDPAASSIEITSLAALDETSSAQNSEPSVRAKQQFVLNCIEGTLKLSAKSFSWS